MTGRVRPADDGGNAIIEFVFVAVAVLVPLVYLIVAVAVVQRSRLATTNAARDVGRAVATSDSFAEAPARAQVALRIALGGQGLRPSEVRLRYVAAGADCQAGSEQPPTLAAGAEFQVCVIRHQPLPAVPTVLSGRGITTIGRYVVHVDEFRTSR
ncbi:MAG: hypothetical protein ACJ74U_18630 [Jatrophihabitantaceae bacterium]